MFEFYVFLGFLFDFVVWLLCWFFAGYVLFLTRTGRRNVQKEKEDSKCCPKINFNELYPGRVDEKHFLLLISIAPIYSVNVYESLRAYFVEGRSRRYICENYRVNNGYLTVSINKINKLHRTLTEISRYYV
ncbi:hypothetical protein V5268_005155 [Escherichia coli]